MGSRAWVIFAIALVLRIALSVISFHPDIQAFAMGNWVISNGHVWNFYDFLAGLKLSPSDQNYPPDFFIYPPIIYFYHALFSFMFAPILGQETLHNFLFNVPNALGHFQFNLELLFLKIPYMVFDLGIAFVFAKLFDNERSRLTAFIFWLFNPITLYATYLMGQFDIIPTSLVILSLYVLLKQKRLLNLESISLAAILLGVGAAFKIYPLFLLIPLVSIESSWLKRIKLLIYGLISYFITILPFIFSHGFRSSALVAGLTTKSLYAQIPISGGEAILLFEGLLLFFYFMFLSQKITPEKLWQRFFIVLLVFFTFTHYHPQWFVWISPFIIFDLIHENFRNKIVAFLALASFFLLLFFFDSSLTLGLFSPVSPNLRGIGSLWSVLHINIDYNFYRSVVQTLFVGCAGFYIYFYFPKNRT